MCMGGLGGNGILRFEASEVDKSSTPYLFAALVLITATRQLLNGATLVY